MTTAAETPASPPSPGDGFVRQRLDLIVAVLLSLATFAVYALTLCRTIYTGDDGDFVTAIATTGVPHPTGYPLFCLVGKLFLLLPFGEPAARINVMTAAVGAASVGFLYRYLVLLAPGRVWAVFGAALFAFAPTMWQQSLSCEVYSLTCLFLTALLYLSLQWRRDPANDRLLRAMAFLYGLALTNHLTMVLFLPGFLVLVLTARPTLLRDGRLLGSMNALFFLPLTLYAYLPLAAAYGHAPLVWGDPKTPANFFAHVSGASYRHAMFQHPEQVPGKLVSYAFYLLGEYGALLLWLAPVGAAGLLRRGGADRAHALLLLYVFAVNIGYAVNYGIFDIYVYFLPSYVAVASLLSAGGAMGLNGIWTRLKTDDAGRQRALRLCTPVLLLVPVVQMSAHFAAADKSGNYLESDFSANVLRSAPPNAVVFVSGNLSFTLWYRQFVLHERPDVVCVTPELYGVVGLGQTWYADHIDRTHPEAAGAFSRDVRLVNRGGVWDPASIVAGFAQDGLRRGVPVLLVPDPATATQQSAEARKDLWEQRLPASLDRVPWGVCERLYPRGQAPGARTLAALTAPLWESYSVRGVYTGWAHNDPLQQRIPLRYALGGVAFGKVAESAGRYDLAGAAYAKASQLYKNPEAEAGLERCSRRLAAAR